MSDSIGHSFLLLRPVLVCARVNQPNKEGKDARASENDSSRMKGNSQVQFVFLGGGEEPDRVPPLTWLGPKRK